jgi:osmotically-inducible protein OsmY
MKFVTILLIGGLFTSLVTACSPTGAVVGGAAVAGTAVAEERTVGTVLDDTGIKIRIGEALLMKNETLFIDVSTKVVEGRVLVTGAVSDPEDRVTAARLIWKVDGVREVYNELQVTNEGNLATYSTDTWISTQLNFSMIGDFDIKHVNYSIETVNGIVYLMGIAQDAAEIERVRNHAREIKGVRKIVSYVQLKEERLKKV